MLISADVLVLLEEEQTMAGAQFFPDIGLMVRGLTSIPQLDGICFFLSKHGKCQPVAKVLVLVWMHLFYLLLLVFLKP